ncbi:receptor-like protein kinase [Gossypium australe]|uniref:Receptor-like protein kinase n=1 Tax=Gossypium australe TaxID=47621 RepID=A0A5B6WUM7_9ROSI|nr:receptor-like protein kinase [Gossypium australe]
MSVKVFDCLVMPLNPRPATVTMKELRNKKISLVKVLWHRHGVEEATWESEDAMRQQYPNLFNGKIFEDENP